MSHVSSFNPSFNPLDKARRHHRMKKGRPLVTGAGDVFANGKLKVMLKTVDGDTVTYIAIPIMSWRFEPDTSVRPKVVIRVMAPVRPPFASSAPSTLRSTRSSLLKNALAPPPPASPNNNALAPSSGEEGASHEGGPAKKRQLHRWISYSTFGNSRTSLIVCVATSRSRSSRRSAMRTIHLRRRGP